MMRMMDFAARLPLGCVPRACLSQVLMRLVWVAVGDCEAIFMTVDSLDDELRQRLSMSLRPWTPPGCTNGYQYNLLW